MRTIASLKTKHMHACKSHITFDFKFTKAVPSQNGVFNDIPGSIWREEPKAMSNLPRIYYLSSVLVKYRYWN